MIIMRYDPLSLRRTSQSRPAGRRHRPRFRLEELEGRVVPTVTFTQTNLVSDVPGMAQRTDPNLVNPWGIAVGLNSGLWVADNHSGVATTYDGAGQPIPAGSPLVVSVPSPDGTGAGAPTGVATNATGKF